MELVSRTIDCSTRQGDEVLLMPIGDIQWYGDERAIALKMLRRHIEWGVANNAYFIGMGDYVDTFSPSNRERLRSAALYDTAREAVDKLTHDLVEEIFERALKPSVGRWLGLLEGHHLHEYMDGTTTDQHLCRLLKAPFLGSSAYVRLVLRRQGASSVPVLIWSHHGVGGGTSLSGPLNQLMNVMKGFHADIYLIGHHTKKVGAPLDRVEPRFGKGGARLVHKTVIVACTGGFMKGYRVGARQGKVPRGNYVEQKMMNPTALGGVLIKLRPRWTKKDGVAVDMSIEQ